MFVKNHDIVTIADRFEMVLGRLHEVAGDAADGFAIALAAQLPGPVSHLQNSQARSAFPESPS